MIGCASLDDKKCPLGGQYESYTPYRSDCYWESDKALSWADAEADCKSKGANLVSILGKSVTNCTCKRFLYSVKNSSIFLFRLGRAGLLIFPYSARQWMDWLEQHEGTSHLILKNRFLIFEELEVQIRNVFTSFTWKLPFGVTAMSWSCKTGWQNQLILRETSAFIWTELTACGISLTVRTRGSTLAKSQMVILLWALT